MAVLTRRAVINAQVLAPLLGPSELASIFGRVAQVFANSLADAFQRLQPQVGPLFHTCQMLCASCPLACNTAPVALAMSVSWATGAKGKASEEQLASFP